MLNILLPGQATLKIEDAQHISVACPGQSLTKGYVEDAQHITPRTGH